jgi:hypothetical protein
LPEIEEVFTRLPHAGDEPEPVVEEEGEDEDFAGRLRGIGGLAPARPEKSEGAGRLMRSSRKDEVWIWEWLLANP